MAKCLFDSICPCNIAHYPIKDLIKKYNLLIPIREMVFENRTDKLVNFNSLTENFVELTESV